MNPKDIEINIENNFDFITVTNLVNFVNDICLKIIIMIIQPDI